MSATWRILEGDCRDSLRSLAPGSVQTCVTSPPYFGLRDYGTGSWEGGDPECDHRGRDVSHEDTNADAAQHGEFKAGSRGGQPAKQRHVIFKEECGKCAARRVDRQIGLEPTPDEFVAALVEVFREVRRVLRDDGTVWLNLGDSYAGNANSGGVNQNDGGPAVRVVGLPPKRGDGIKPKDLLGIPWAVAEALRDPYYTGRITLERDRVWMAAMIDGEGTICGFNHERADGDGIRTGVNLCITNSSEALLAEAERIWSASRCEHMSRDGALGNKPCWRWLVHGIENKTEFLREVYPHLIVKRKQAVLAYNLLELMADAKRLGHSPQRDAVREKRALLVRLMSEANKGDCDVPSWCVEPPSMFEPGWYLRSDIIWSKPNPMPESVTDRPTKAHEYLFLLSKSARYFYDADAIRETAIHEGRIVKAYGADAKNGSGATETNDRRTAAGFTQHDTEVNGRNRRSVWTVATQPYAGAHFATFPPKLIEPCILAGSREGDTVLDPFMGSGTTGVVALRRARGFVGCELNPEYVQLARDRIIADAPLLNTHAEEAA